MPIAPTYPGVYVQEKASGVRTITGVSTSVTAFLGTAKRGPIDKPTHVQGFAAFERIFGGLDRGSEMSYAVRQFFANGGADAWVVRLAANAAKASALLADVESPAKNVLEVTAVDEGAAANSIRIQVDYATPTPASTFNLTFSYIPDPTDPSTVIRETFKNLSMNSGDQRYVEDVVNGSSTLVTVKRTADMTVLSATAAGFSLSDVLPDPLTNTFLDDRHNSFRVSVNGLTPVTVTLNPATMGTAKLADLCAEIQKQVIAGGTPSPEYTKFTCGINGPAGTSNQLKLTSGVQGEASTVRVMPGITNDVSFRLKLGVANGGSSMDAVALVSPIVVPATASLTGGKLPAFPFKVAAPDTTFSIVLNGSGPTAVTLGAATYNKIDDLAALIQQQVRGAKPANPAYSNFTAAANSTKDALVLTSGVGGGGSAVLVTPDGASKLADQLLLTSTATASAPPQDVTLAGGTGDPVDDTNAFATYTGSQSQRTGLFALESVDLFNILCLPGISDPGILSEAVTYCKARRAFLIVDSPAPTDANRAPDTMAAYAQSSSLPKENYAGVYYPWVKIPDPLNNGKLRLTAPCGTVAGIFARTDGDRGIWKAPAGTDATLTNVQAVDYKLTDGENGILNPHAVNCIRLFPVYGPVVWGARTLQGDDQQASEWKYVPVRRLALFIEESLFRGTKWVVFEPNDEPLWAQIRLNIGAFMHNLFRQGAFQGSSPAKAYFVKCDAETTTQNDIDLGVVNILVGFAPLKPAEFVIITIQQIAGNIQV